MLRLYNYYHYLCYTRCSITLIVYKTTSEIVALITKIPSVEKLMSYAQLIIVEAGDIIGRIEPQVADKIFEYLQKLLTNAINIGIGMLNKGIICNS